MLDKVDSNEKSLNLILTISNHPPFEENVFEYGFNFDIELYKSKMNYSEKSLPAKALGHIWYADKAIGSFVEEAEKKYKKPLFAFTGDHFSRRFINNFSTLKQQSTVPFIIYSASLTNNTHKNNIPGSHIDITPTLVELIAPVNFTYYSFGKSLLQNENYDYGIGFNKTVKRDVIFEFSKNYGIKEQKFTNYTVDKRLGYKSKKIHDSIMSLAWHYTIKGDTIN